MDPETVLKKQRLNQWPIEATNPIGAKLWDIEHRPEKNLRIGFLREILIFCERLCSELEQEENERTFLEKNQSRGTQTISSSSWMKWNSWLFPALEDFLHTFILWRTSQEVLKSQWNPTEMGKTKPWTMALWALFQGDWSEQSHTEAEELIASHFQTCTRLSRRPKACHYCSLHAKPHWNWVPNFPAPTRQGETRQLSGSSPWKCQPWVVKQPGFLKHFGFDITDIFQQTPSLRGKKKRSWNFSTQLYFWYISTEIALHLTAFRA